MTEHMPQAATTPPIEPASDQAGGGTPIAAPSVGVCPEIHPASEIPQSLQETMMTGLAVLESLESQEDREPLEIRWSGAPTREALRQLRLESSCPGFCALQAWEVLTAMYEGATLSAVCRRAGMPKRSVVLWWAELVPEFGVMLEKAQVSLGSALRDRAVDLLEAEDADAALSRAALAVAGAYDRRISKGDEGGSVVQGLTVNVSW